MKFMQFFLINIDIVYFSLFCNTLILKGTVNLSPIKFRVLVSKLKYLIYQIQTNDAFPIYILLQKNGIIRACV